MLCYHTDHVEPPLSDVPGYVPLDHQTSEDNPVSPVAMSRNNYVAYCSAYCCTVYDTLSPLAVPSHDVSLLISAERAGIVFG